MATKKLLGVPKKKTSASSTLSKVATAKFPRHAVGKAIRIAQHIFDQNVGKACTRSEAAKFFGLSIAGGPFSVEISSAIKYGFVVVK